MTTHMLTTDTEERYIYLSDSMPFPSVCDTLCPGRPAPDDVVTFDPIVWDAADDQCAGCLEAMV